MLEEKILEEGPESVVAFIMEPIGGAATDALVAPDSYYPRIREICDRYGILLIHDEVMSGVGAHRQIPRRRPLELPPRHHRAVERHRLGLRAARRHGCARAAGSVRCSTWAASSTATPMPAIRWPAPPGLPCLARSTGSAWSRMPRRMGEMLMDALRDLAKRFPFIGDVRGKGLLTALEFVADPATMERLPPEIKIGQRVLDLAYERGLIVYFRRVKGGVQGDCLMVCPPLIVTRRADRRDHRRSSAMRWRRSRAELDLPVNGCMSSAAARGATATVGIRSATTSDDERIHGAMLELARACRERDKIDSTPDDIRRYGFGASRRIRSADCRD